MIAGAPLSFWIYFHAAVLAVLLVDLFWLQRKSKEPAQSTYVAWTVALTILSLGFGGVLYLDRGHTAALEFISGYAIELSLSVDNLFVFLLLFSSFDLDSASQKRALTWGVAGALVMRGLFIVAGVALLKRFAAVEYVFGAILMFAAIRLLFQKEQRQKQPAWIRLLTRGGKAGSSIFLMAVLAVEVTDLVFALDSVPAVIAVSKQTYIIYTSNICAVLGLRSLYFVLAGMLHKLRLLHYGLAIILAFVAAKMLFGHWFTVSTLASLAIILTTVAIFTLASLLTNTPPSTQEAPPSGPQPPR